MPYARQIRPFYSILPAATAGAIYGADSPRQTLENLYSVGPLRFFPLATISINPASRSSFIAR